MVIARSRKHRVATDKHCHSADDRAADSDWNRGTTVGSRTLGVSGTPASDVCVSWAAVAGGVRPLEADGASAGVDDLGLCSDGAGEGEGGVGSSPVPHCMHAAGCLWLRAPVEASGGGAETLATGELQLKKMANGHGSFTEPVGGAAPPSGAEASTSCNRRSRSRSEAGLRWSAGNGGANQEGPPPATGADGDGVSSAAGGGGPNKEASRRRSRLARCSSTHSALASALAVPTSSSASASGSNGEVMARVDFVRSVATSSRAASTGAMSKYAQIALGSRRLCATSEARPPPLRITRRTPAVDCWPSSGARDDEGGLPW